MISKENPVVQESYAPLEQKLNKRASRIIGGIQIVSPDDTNYQDNVKMNSVSDVVLISSKNLRGCVVNGN